MGATMFPRIFPTLLLLAFAEIMVLRTCGATNICSAPSMLMKVTLCFSTINCAFACEMEGYQDGECKMLQCICKKDCVVNRDLHPPSSGFYPGQSPPKNSGGNVVAQGPSSGGVDPGQGPPSNTNGYDPAQGSSWSDTIPAQGSPSGNDPTQGPSVNDTIPAQGSPSGNGPTQGPSAQGPYVDFDFVIPNQGPPTESGSNNIPPGRTNYDGYFNPALAPPVGSVGNNPFQRPSDHGVDLGEGQPRHGGNDPAQGPYVDYVIPNQGPPTKSGGFNNIPPGRTNYDGYVNPALGPPTWSGGNNPFQGPSNHGVDPGQGQPREGSNDPSQALSTTGDYLAQGPPRKGGDGPFDQGYDSYNDGI